MAKRLGISRSELFQRAMRSFLKEHNNKEITEALNAVCFNQNNRVGLDPVLERMQKASITREER
jgi:metal-responsive CopG/Arc/MetJ family transcriptional regulator